MSIHFHLILILSIYCQYVNSSIKCGISQSMAYPTSECNKNKRMTRVVGGRPASIEEMPWMSSLIINNYGYCGSVIIAERWLLTAAHCFGNGNVNTIDVLVRIGSSNKLRGQLMAVKNYFIHPIYAKNGYIVNDIALIELKDSIPFNISSANSVCIPESTEQNESSELTVFAGWGQTYIDGSKPTNLLKKSIHYTIPLNQCKYSSDSFVCVNASHGMGCSGDSGSPLIRYNGCQAVLMGIFSYAERNNKNERCGPGLMLFVRVSKHLQWIQSLIGNLNVPGHTTDIPAKTDIAALTDIANITDKSTPSPTDRDQGLGKNGATLKMDISLIFKYLSIIFTVFYNSFKTK